jgi:glycosyltransferase 2 family protein
MTYRRTLLWLLQGVLAVVVGAYFFRAISRHWDEYRALDFPIRIRVGWVLVAASVVLVTYVLLIAAWRLVLIGWGERLPFARAVRVWTLSNMGRYLPGKVWSVAGLAVLAQREGVAGWSAVGAAIAMQAVAVGSGMAVAAGTVPGALSTARLGVAAGIAVATVAALASTRAMGLLARLSGRGKLRAIPLGSVAVASAVMIVAWAGYGFAFWCLARGTLGATSLTAPHATGVFAAGYLVGLVMIFSPGGVGAREAVLIPMLTPSLGPGGALVLTLASRILLTLMEALAALLGLALGGPPTAPATDAQPRSGSVG